MSKINRRTALKTLGLATAGVATAGLAACQDSTATGQPAAQTTTAQTATSPLATGASATPSANASGQTATQGVVGQTIPQSSLLPFEGVHQAGIITQPPEAVLLVSLDLLVADRDELTSLFKKLTGRMRDLMGGSLGDFGVATPEFSPDNSGELGGDPLKEGHLAITLGIGASVFEQNGKDRFGLASQKPLALKPMPRDLAGDRLDQTLLDGDLFLQISSDHPLYNMHALRDILRHTKGQLSPRWVQPGFQRFFAAGPGQANARGLLGFKDGTANLPVNDDALMSKLVWTGAEEPAWAQGGTYVAVRKIREQIERWDRLTLYQQEASIGREKLNGASLDRSKETDLPNYTGDPEGDKVPLDAHIRKANPRLGEESDKRRMLRRGYLYFNGVDKSGLLDAGFLFMGFCRNVQEQFEYVKRNYMTNRSFPKPGTGAQDLDEYIFAIGGGYFFIPPGVKATGRFLADALLS
jgi:deferrochelatase/peroxidase EfeB